MLRIGRALGASLLIAQLGFVAAARLGPARYFCWAPFHEQAWYRLDVQAGGRALDDAEVAARYRIVSFYGNARTGERWELNSIQHVMDVVRQYEETRGRGDGAQVTLTYRRNGGPPETWRWPPP